MIMFTSITAFQNNTFPFGMVIINLLIFYMNGIKLNPQALAEIKVKEESLHIFWDFYKYIAFNQFKNFIWADYVHFHLKLLFIIVNGNLKKYIPC